MAILEFGQVILKSANWTLFLLKFEISFQIVGEEAITGPTFYTDQHTETEKYQNQGVTDARGIEGRLGTEEIPKGELTESRNRPLTDSPEVEIVDVKAATQIGTKLETTDTNHDASASVVDKYPTTHVQHEEQGVGQGNGDPENHGIQYSSKDDQMGNSMSQSSHEDKTSTAGQKGNYPTDVKEDKMVTALTTYTKGPTFYTDTGLGQTTHSGKQTCV